MEHLNESTLLRLLNDPKSMRALGEHLASGCEACEGFLEQTGRFDGEVDSVLTVLAPRAQRLDEVGWVRLRRALRQPSRVRWAAGAIAAALALALLAPRLLAPHDASEVGLKGPVSTVSLELQAAVKTPDGEVRRIDDGAKLRADGVLLFHYHSSATVDGSVWLSRRGAPPTRLGQVKLQSGTHELTANGTLIGLSLEGESGEVTVWVVGGKADTSDLEPATAVAALRSGKELAVGRVTVQVQP